MPLPIEVNLAQAGSLCHPGAVVYDEPMIRACSHLVLATSDVARMKAFFGGVFGCDAHFANPQFCEFVLPNQFRVAFFEVVGKTTQFFRADSDREGLSLGVTVEDVDAVFARVEERHLQVSGPPKDHPWGERSFLLVDPDGNRWEVTQSPSEDGMLIPRDFGQ